MIEIKIENLDFEAGYADVLDLVKDEGGIYIFFGTGEFKDEYMYIGSTKRLRTRIREHYTGNSNTYDVYEHLGTVIGFYCSCPSERLIYEIYLIKTLKPKLNVQYAFNYKNKRDDFVSEDIKKQIRLEEERENREYQKNMVDIVSSLNL